MKNMIVLPGIIALKLYGIVPVNNKIFLINKNSLRFTGYVLTRHPRMLTAPKLQVVDVNYGLSSLTRIRLTKMKKLKQPTKAGPVPKTEKNNQNSKAVREKNEGFPGYPLYPSADDIYNRGKKMDLNPEGMSETKDPVEKLRKNNDVVPDGDLDVPGAELDDKQENVGSEDEENNYYSLGGDGHTDLDEDTAGS